MANEMKTEARKAPPQDAVGEDDLRRASTLEDEDTAAIVEEVAEAIAKAELAAEQARASAEAELAAAAGLEVPPGPDQAGAAEGGPEAPPSSEAAGEGTAAEGAAEAERLVEEVRALSEDQPTAEEEALAQAEEEVDPEGDVLPAEIEEIDEEAQSSLEKLAARARRLSDDQARHAIHSLLFVADKPLSAEQLRRVTGLEPARIRASLEQLAGELREGISGVVLSEVGGGWQLRTAPESAEFVRRFLQVKPRRLTRAALETLAIVAYRQPVTRPEIEEIRGVDCGAVLKALLDWKLLKVLGKKEEVGRPLLYGTTREFLEFFQLKDLGSLPTLREFHELNEESRQIVEEELGPEAVEGIAGTFEELADPSFLEAEQEREARSEAALADLEQAMATAEEIATGVAENLAPKKDAEEGEGDEARPAAARGS